MQDASEFVPRSFKPRFWAPTVNEKDAILEAMQEQPDWEDPAVADAAGRAALRGSADCFSPASTSEVATTARLGHSSSHTVHLTTSSRASH